MVNFLICYREFFGASDLEFRGSSLNHSPFSINSVTDFLILANLSFLSIFSDTYKPAFISSYFSSLTLFIKTSGAGKSSYSSSKAVLWFALLLLQILFGFDSSVLLLHYSYQVLHSFSLPVTLWPNPQYLKVYHQLLKLRILLETFSLTSTSGLLTISPFSSTQATVLEQGP